MARSIEVELYNFDELPPDKQEKVIEKLAQQNQEFFDSDCLTTQFGDFLQEWGFPTGCIEWSLSYSQGDGVAFYGDVNVTKFLKHYKDSSYNPLLKHTGIDMYVRITRNSYGHHYAHYGTMSIEGEIFGVDRDVTPFEQRLFDDFEVLIENKVVAVSKQLEKVGYAELDCVSSRDYILHQIEANEWEFTGDGEIA